MLRQAPLLSPALRWSREEHPGDRRATNCVYDVFSSSEGEFRLLFPEGQDIAFIDEVYANGNREALDQAFNAIWFRRLPKREVNGIHGTLFYELEGKKAFYPTRKDEEAVNPDGTKLR